MKLAIAYPKPPEYPRKARFTKSFTVPVEPTLRDALRFWWRGMQVQYSVHVELEETAPGVINAPRISVSMDTRRDAS